DDLAQLLGEPLGRLERLARGDDDELLAADAKQAVRQPHARLDSMRDSAKDLVARAMPVHVVDALEVIDIEQDKRRRPPRALEARHDLGELREEGAAIADSGQRVEGGEPQELILLPVVQDRE